MIWTYVTPDRQVLFHDVSDKTMFSARRREGMNYLEFPAMSRAEKTRSLRRAMARKRASSSSISKGFVR